MDIDKINELYYRHMELLKENAGEKDGSAGKKRLKYTYEWVTAFLPRDMDISNRAAQDKVLDLAFQEALKRLVHNRKNPRLAAQNMFGDEDFPMEVISQYAWYQKHGFPDATEDGWYAAEDAEERAGANEEQNEEEGEDYVAGMGMPDFTREDWGLIQDAIVDQIAHLEQRWGDTWGQRQQEKVERLEAILKKMSFNPKRNLEGHENEEQNEGED
jgi:hypothetical protein